jgi:integrase
MNLKEAHDEYYELWSPDASEKTLERHRYDIKRWRKLMGDLDVTEIRTHEFARYRKLAKASQAANTVNTTCRTVSQILRCCAQQGVIEQAPDPGRQLNVAGPEPHVPTVAELDRLYRATHLAAWPRSHVRPWEWWRCLMVVGIWTGLRLQDLLWGLAWQHIDFEERSITFRASKTRRYKKLHTFPIVPIVERHLRAMIPPGPHCPSSRRVFGPSQCTDLIRRELRRFSADAGIDPSVTMQTFRRASITLWSRADHTAGQLVHGTGLPKVMLHYLHVGEILRSASERFPWPPVMADHTPGTVCISSAPAEPPAPPPELIAPTGTDPALWRFKSGQFQYAGGPWFKMSGRRLAFLRVLASTTEPVNWRAFVPIIYPKGTDPESIDTSEDRRIHVTLSQVRSRLRECFGLNGFDPIQCIERGNGGGDFVLFLPEHVGGTEAA